MNKQLKTKTIRKKSGLYDVPLQSQEDRLAAQAAKEAEVTAFSDGIRKEISARRGDRKRKPSRAQRDAPLHLRRSLMASGHMSARGTATDLMRPIRVRRHIVVADWLQATAITVTGKAYELQLDQIPGFADFTALFDQYRFSRVHAKLLTRTNVQTLTQQSGATTFWLPYYALASDPDDSTAPSTFNELLEYEGVKVYAGYQNGSYSYKPRAAIAAYGGAFTQFADFDGWMDCASDDTAYYALKAVIQGGGASQTILPSYDLHLKVDCEFRFFR